MRNRTTDTDTVEGTLMVFGLNAGDKDASVKHPPVVEASADNPELPHIR